MSSSEIAARSTNNQSLVTVKRQLASLTKQGYIEQSGAGRSIKYTLTKKGWLLKPIELAPYLKIDPDERMPHPHFKKRVFEKPYIDLFNNSELTQLKDATTKYKNNAAPNDSLAHKKELMRFIVEFSWKSSKIEGNTYDLISTERLLLFGEKSTINTEYETQMILNQKNAIEFILENVDAWKNPTTDMIKSLHSHVANKLDIPIGFRNTLVGITGTNYRPLWNESDIKDALNLLLENINHTKNIYEKGLLAVLGLSYIQAFVDGNKRTSRLLANAILMANNFAPLSYRNVDDKEYKEACLVFYEQNSIVPFKKIFVDQYIFSANNYNIARPTNNNI